MGMFGILIAVPLCAVCYTLLKQKLEDVPEMEHQATQDHTGT